MQLQIEIKMGNRSILQCIHLLLNCCKYLFYKFMIEWHAICFDINQRYRKCAWIILNAEFDRMGCCFSVIGSRR